MIDGWSDPGVGRRRLHTTCSSPELPIYLQRAASFTADYSGVDAFTDGVLRWWRNNNSAQIVFAMSPNLACCERVFALLKNMFGEQQMQALADYVQAALMLRYNGRVVG